MDDYDHNDKEDDDILSKLTSQDLDPLSIAELKTRILTLKEEIGRCENKIKSAISHRADAESLFKSK